MERFALAEEILAFWFADALASPQTAGVRSKVWFKHDPNLDAALAARFADCPREAASGQFDAWAAYPQASLARILLLDQFPRNLYRGTAAAFSCDARAQAAALGMTDSGQDLLLHPLHAVFVYMPFEHAEDVALQERAVHCFEALEARVEPGWEDLFRGYSDYARRHRAVIARFGRFPHRNDALGRQSTPEESAYLASGFERFGPSSA
jgi:uncharacterized protein (DUF924 family)